MGINVSLAGSQANSISHHASALRDIKYGLNLYKASLNSAWQGAEMQYVNNAIDRINNELAGLASELDSLAGDIVSVAAEIRREEEAREAAERAAREAAAREAAAREAAARGNRDELRSGQRTKRDR